jgi:hypothetical protein
LGANRRKPADRATDPLKIGSKTQIATHVESNGIDRGTLRLAGMPV